ncbi:MAG: hypothetical protein MUO92_03605, partial [Dehalococcoidales bacterium]|nr:hypothetical protein [Dehalococcoidales bacterium]
GRPGGSQAGRTGGINMIVATHVFGIIGTILGGFASFYLAFGFTKIIGDRLHVKDEPEKCWIFLKLNTLEKVQKFIYILLGTGFVFLLISQVLSCLIQ